MPSSTPHAACSSGTPAEEFICRLFDRLWDEYRQRVRYVREYEAVIAAAGATFVNDHIAFRSLAGASPYAGPAPLARLFTAMGYRATGLYAFESKHLDAIHYQHANPRLPKLFLSELRTWELPADVREILSARSTSTEISLQRLAEISSLAKSNEVPAAMDQLVEQVADLFRLPAARPIDEQQLLRVNEVSQYAAWVVLHGPSVNHFTSLINSHGVDALNDIEKTVAALADAGIPLKADIEGERGSCLRQTATEAVDVEVTVLRDGQVVARPWTYAYFELAERGVTTGPDGAPVRFEGFLGDQATHLFEMTRRMSQ